jgi:glycosyltransferase involved in cell wall biosynthesis
VVNEALAAGVPCVVSDQCGCAPDLIVSGKTGEVFPCGDIGAMANAIERCLKIGLGNAEISNKSAIYTVENAASGIEAAVLSLAKGQKDL